MIPIRFPARSNFRSHIMDLKYRSPSNKDFYGLKNQMNTKNGILIIYVLEIFRV